MQLNEKLKNILLDINFEQSYKLISEKNLLIEGANRFENYSNDEVLSIFKSLGYWINNKPKFNNFGLFMFYEYAFCVL
mgnify:CR=1 FL=1